MDTWCHGDLAAVLHASHFLNTNTHNIKNSYDMGLTVETSELQDKPNIIFDRSVKCDHQRRRTLSMMANSEEGLDDSYHSRPFFPARNSLSQRRRRQQQRLLPTGAACRDRDVGRGPPRRESIALHARA